MENNMVLGEFLNAVQKMREYQNSWRKHHRKSDAGAAHEWAKIVDRGLVEGVTVVMPLEDAPTLNELVTTEDHYDKKA